MGRICMLCRDQFEPKNGERFCLTCLERFMPRAARNVKLTCRLAELGPENLIRLETMLSYLVDGIGDAAFSLSVGELAIILIAESMGNVMPRAEF